MRLISNNENLVIQKDAISGRLEIQKKLDYSTNLDKDAASLQEDPVDSGS